MTQRQTRVVLPTAPAGVTIYPELSNLLEQCGDSAADSPPERTAALDALAE